MNRRLLVLSLALFSITHLFAQAPKGINYQGIARDNEGKPIASKTISVRISILKNSATGEVEYAEVHKRQTNQFGLFTLVIGQGTVETGSFAFVSWAVGNKWLQIELDPEGNSTYLMAGSQQLMSVPYAFYSEYSGNGLTAGTGIAITNNQIHNTGDGDNNPSNELITDAALTTDGKLRLTEAGITKEVDLSPLAGGFLSGLKEVLTQSNDAGAIRIGNLGSPLANSDAATKAYVDAHTDGDASATNEIQDLTLTGSTLKVTNNPQATSIDLSALLDNTDGQVLTLTGTTLAISNGNQVDLGSLNTDSQTLQLTGNFLAISNGNSINLSSVNTDNQTLGLTGTNLSITNGNTINLSTINTDNQNLTLGTASGTNRTINISNGTGVTLDVADNDNSTSNEIQTLSKSGSTVSLNLGGGSITLNDDSPTNEIQDLSLIGNTLRVTDNPSATAINLAPYLDNTDNQILSLTGTSLSIANGNTVNLGPINTDNQNLSLGTASGTNRTINISNGTGVTIDVADGDSNPTNEIQNLSLGTGSGTNRVINISGGTGVTIDVADNDNNTTNEVQTISKTGSTISLNLGGGSITLNDDSSTNELQTLSYTPSSNELTISGGNSVTISTNLNQVLANNPSAGGIRIQNLGTPTATTDATTKGYVDTSISTALATNYAFKVPYSFTNSGGTFTNALVSLGTDIYDNFNVVSSNRFTVPVGGDGMYMFYVDGTSTNTSVTLKVRVNGITIYSVKRQTSFPSALTINDNTNLMLRLVAGDYLELVVDSVNSVDQVTGLLFGYRL